MAFSHTYDVATPVGSADDPAEADDRMREIKDAVQERENVDHYWPKTGTEVSDEDTGEHRKVTLRVGSAPSAVANKGFVYIKDISDKAELFYRDEDGDEVQLTSGGKILSASLDMKDQDNMSSNSATHAATQQSIKAYADAIAVAAAAAVVAAIAGDSPTLNDSESNALLINHAYKTTCTGFVTAFAGGATSTSIKGYVGTTNDPAGVGQQMNWSDGAAASHVPGISFMVGKGKYFEVTAGIALTITWTPLPSGGGAPVDQD